ncbi:uncharacterized protein J4E92_005157 [Alternaria infectoria]|nr:uncharacterized protein J4E92_005157 [Alternaria infectoria]KAI4929492.1 hypothetical protein J4E92_005157 [Alternaria infectoria]
MSAAPFPPGPSNVKMEQTPEPYNIKQEEYLQQERESTVGTMDATTRTTNWVLQGNNGTVGQAVPALGSAFSTPVPTTQAATAPAAQTTAAQITQNSMASSRYAQPEIQADPSPAALNRLASKRLLEDDSFCTGSPTNKRIKAEPSSSVSGTGVPRIKLEPSSSHTETPPMHRAPENDITEIIKTCTKVNLKPFELEYLSKIQTRIDWVFNHGAKSFDILSEIKAMPNNPPDSYTFSLKPEQNRRIGELQKRMKDAQTQFNAQGVKANPLSTPKGRKIKNCRARTAKSPSVSAEQGFKVEKLLGMLMLNDESGAAVAQAASNLLASRGLKFTLCGKELRLVES